MYEYHLHYEYIYHQFPLIIHYLKDLNHLVLKKVEVEQKVNQSFNF